MKNRTRAVTALAIAVVFAIVQPAYTQTKLVGPHVTALSPQTPVRSGASQVLTITGSGFAPGLSVELITPAAQKRSYAGSSIQAQSATSFQVAVSLATAGAYTLTISNPDGAASDPFVFKVQPGAVTPSIERVLPDQVNKDSNPQALQVRGDRFQAGLSVSLTDPTGAVSIIKGAAIGAVSATSFELSVVLDKAGEYALFVTNPSGESSNSVSLNVAIRAARR